MTASRLVAAFVCFALHFRAPAAGPVYNLNSFSDVEDKTLNGVCETNTGNNICTLRAAVMEANYYLSQNGQAAEEVTIQLQLGTYTLSIPIGTPDDDSNGDLNLTGKVRLVGKGAGALNTPATIIDAHHGDRIFSIANGAIVTLQDVWIQGGRPPNNGPRGRNGGGIQIIGATLTLRRCLVRDNVVTTNNAYGGGIHAELAVVDVIDSNFRLNRGFVGGAIYSVSSTTSILRSTLNGNDATIGGAILQSDGALNVSNSTISDNYAIANGGGIVLSSGAEARLANVTLAFNRADDPAPSGGGISLGFGSSVALSNSILFNARGASFLDDLECSESTVSSNGHNFIFQPGNCTVAGAYSNALPQLMPIGEYGGPYATRPVVAASDAVNAGPATGCEDAFGAPLTTDQRGVKRPIGSACDLGAVEVEPIGDVNGDGIVSVGDILYLINYLFAGGVWPLGRANVNGDMTVTVADVLYLINYLFAGGPAPV